MEDAMLGDFTNGEGDQSLPVIPSGRMSVRRVCTADGLTTDPGLQAHPPHVTSQSTIKWPCQGLPGLARGQYGGS
jgi:hypothetical protein